MADAANEPSTTSASTSSPFATPAGSARAQSSKRSASAGGQSSGHGADRGDDPEQGIGFWRGLLEWIITLVVVIAVLLPIRSVIIDWNDVPSGSMIPNIHIGDRIWVNKLAFGLRVPFTNTYLIEWGGGPQRGQVVTFAKPPGEKYTDDGITLVKRVIGLPGDTISMVDDKLIINGKPLEYDMVSNDQPVTFDGPEGTGITVSGRRLMEHLPGGCDHTIDIAPSQASPHKSFAEITVPPDSYFMMGDNRDESGDSRVFGFVKRDLLYGRSSYVVISFRNRNWLTPDWSRFFTAIP